MHGRLPGSCKPVSGDAPIKKDGWCRKFRGPLRRNSLFRGLWVPREPGFKCAVPQRIALPRYDPMKNHPSSSVRPRLHWLLLAAFFGFLAAPHARAGWVWVEGYSETIWVPEITTTEWVDGYFQEVVVTVQVQLPDGSWTTETSTQVVYVEGHWEVVTVPGYLETVYHDGHWVWEDDGTPQP